MTQAPAPLTVNGWSIYAHSLFLDQLEALVEAVESTRAQDPVTYASRNDAKRLQAILELAFNIIPQDPTRPEYRQGNTLGAQNKRWFRAKFFQQYRLFFRFSSRDRIIVIAWVNDEGTKRAYGSTSDAYKVFAKMLKSGNPPNDWDELVLEAKANAARLQPFVPEQ